jgi:choice-of-anchor B domain-containing protein
MPLLLVLCGTIGCSEPTPDPRLCPGSSVLALITHRQDAASCVDGVAGGFPCSNVDLSSALTFCYDANDVWGWEDPDTGREYALLGLANGTTFVDVTDPEDPRVVGLLPTHSWIDDHRDLKVLGNFAYMVSEAPGHGLQVFDLTRLRRGGARTIFTEDAHFSGFSTAHNLAINEQTAFAYALGSEQCMGGLYMIDLSSPLNPLFAGCYSGDGYSHDAQCVIYQGPDLDYRGREICFNSNEDSLTIVDVTVKSSPVMIRRVSYAGVAYAHQGWLSEDHRHFFLDDEVDELVNDHNTRTYVFDVSDLDTATVGFSYDGDAYSSDHNLYIQGQHVYQANYTSGLRILRSGDLDQGELLEVGYFDTVPKLEEPGFLGAWTAYPYLPSGTILVSDSHRGLFLLTADLTAVPECDDGLDNDRDGDIDFGQDVDCQSAADLEE